MWAEEVNGQSLQPALGVRVVQVAGCPTKLSIARWAYQLQPVEMLCACSHVRILLELVCPKKRNTENPWETKWVFNFGISRWFLDKVTAAGLLDPVPTDT